MKCPIVLLFVCGIAACNEPAKQTETVSVKEKFDAIEKIVGTANWELVSLPESDTSFMYFSRIGDAAFNIYSYRIEKGDSVESQTNSIVSHGDSVLWLRGDKPQLQMIAINDTSFTLKEEHSGRPAERVLFTKKDSLHVNVADTARVICYMRQTLPLSVFLVRKKYDYLHGTSYADSAEIAPRPIKKSK